ncbi:PREDICTED: kallikrein-4-like [Chinchilla lanigera]|uniref:kallikrein-4-like n=1 Tax=Chinchilla lanigera TaxID=34839 RepID=UPI000697C50E|nr:PREDICTED: kallikrein-4-like [Chinchilla lanigera]
MGCGPALEFGLKKGFVTMVLTFIALRSYTIGLGLHRVHQWYETGSQMTEAIFSVQHPYYTVPWRDHDLMLIKLSKPVGLSETIQTIHIASKCPETGTMCSVSGWGQYPDSLQCVHIPVVLEEYCKAVYEESYHDSMFCAGGEGHKDSCPVRDSDSWQSSVRAASFPVEVTPPEPLEKVALQWAAVQEARIPPKGTGNHFPDVPLRIRKRIADGFPCNPHSQPWMAALFDNYTQYCAGVLVHPQWVLSAAHCWRPSYTIVLGLHGLYDWFEPGSQIIQACFSVQHPDHLNSSRDSDLMLIKLNTPVVESDTIKTIPIASRCPTSGTRCRTSGWGQLLNGYDYPYYLQCAIIPVVSEKICRFELESYYDDSMFCAGGEGYQDVCLSDSGGPLVCGGVLQGLVSWGFKPCGEPGVPSVFTNLCKFKEWINEVIQTT